MAELRDRAVCQPQEDAGGADVGRRWRSFTEITRTRN